MRRVLVCGAGGFIGSHLVKRLKAEGHWVYGVDLKRPEWEPTAADIFELGDLRREEDCRDVFRSHGFDDVYQLAADMGGIGYITASRASVARNNVLINANMLTAATKLSPAGRYLYTSSACVYPAGRQASASGGAALTEGCAIPADPERGYGWEKLFSEQLTDYYREDYGLNVRVVRFHNVYGPNGTYDGGKEKAPAAVCRKVAEATDTIEVWGDGEQTRSFMYIDDCVEGLLRIMESDYQQPINLGTEEMVTVNQLVDIACKLADKRLAKRHDLTAPQGVRGRNSDNTLLRKVLDWEPRIPLIEGLAKTYPWIAEQVRAK